MEQIDEYLSKQGLTESLRIVKSVASFPEDGETAETLLERAERRLAMKTKVLLVDDEPEFVQLLKNRLSATERYTCLEAFNGEEALKLQALENGLMCYPMAGTLDGVSGDHVVLAPPYIITEAQLDEIVDKLERSIGEVIATA